MRIVTAMRLWLRALFHSRAVERDLEREIRFHLEMEADMLRRGGVPGDEAARRARLAFGGVERAKEAVRDERGVRWIEELGADARYAIRGLRRVPAFAVAAVTVLALGIGAATSVFTVVRHVLWDGLPFPRSERLVFVTEATARGDAMLTSFPNFDDWRHRARSFAAMTAVVPASTAPVVVGGQARRASFQAVSREFFEVFDVAPLLGRTISRAENAPGAPLVAVVGERFWREALGATPRLDTLRLDAGGSVFAVVGVMPRDFRVLEDADVWVAGEGSPVRIRGAGNYWVVGRLADGATIEGARREMNALAGSLASEYGDQSVSSSVVLEPVRDRVVGAARRPLVMLLAAAVFVLVVTCASVAMMQLARSASRDAELAVRTALGAGRLRLLRQLATEQVVLAAFGCAGGALVAWAAVAAARRYGAGVVPRIDTVVVDWRMLAGSVAAAAAATVLFGAVPVTRLLRGRTARPSTSRVSAGARSGAALIGLQAAVMVLLLTGASMLARSVYNVVTADLGYDRHGAVSVNVPLLSARYARPQERIAFATRLRATLAEIPSVNAVGLTSQLPSERGGNRGPILVPPFGDPNAQRSWAAIAALRVVTPDYFGAMRIPLLRGRGFFPAEPAASRAVVINRSLADAIWPGRDAVGRQLRALVDARNDTLTVVGVVADARDWQSEPGQQPELYVTLAQRPELAWQLDAVVRGSEDRQALVAEVRRRAQALDPELAPVVQPLDAAVTGSIGDRRLVAAVLVAFAAVVLTLAVAGIVGSVGYVVARRRRELGIRIAIGATRRDVWLLVQRGVVSAALGGALVGLIASLEAGGVLSPMLYRVAPRDPLALALAAAITTVAILGAAALPALRATRVDPAAAVRLD